MGLWGDLVLSKLAEKSATSAEPFADLPFEDFCERYLLVQNKAGEIVPLRLNRAQRHLVAHLTGRDLVLKARQLGMSTVIQALLFYKQMKGRARTSTLCHEDELTSTLRRMTDLFYGELDSAVRPERRYANAKLTTYEGLRSEGSIATVGGQAGARKGRGASVTHIHGSEVAYWPNADGVMSAAMQAGNPDIILESTANGMVGWFYERCMEALDGQGVWTLHFFPWWWDDDYRLPLMDGERLVYTDEEQKLVEVHGLAPEQIKWRREKQKELPHTFLQEYPEDPLSCFLASGNSFFGNVEHVYTAPEGAAPQPDHRYVGGLDFAQSGDYLVLVILDATERRMVDMLRIQQLEWQEMRRRVSVVANYWDAKVTGEANSMGATNIELLQRGEVLADGSRIAPVRLTPFETTAQSKAPLIQGLYHALHEAGLQLLDRAELKHELRAFISKQTVHGHWQYEAGEGAHDDTVIALALAWHGAQNPMTIEFAPNPFYGG